jgi:hypothetical protein
MRDDGRQTAGTRVKLELLMQKHQNLVAIVHVVLLKIIIEYDSTDRSDGINNSSAGRRTWPDHISHYRRPIVLGRSVQYI